MKTGKKIEVRFQESEKFTAAPRQGIEEAAAEHDDVRLN